MTALKDRIAALIEAEGPISLAAYMSLCLTDPEHGYYSQSKPFGREGDFITAPEISQIFGELIAVWLVEQHQNCAITGAFTLAELGPGRGTLMADILRTLRQIAPDMLASAEIVLLEASEKLRATQKEKLAPFGKEIQHLETLGTLPKQPLLLVANEFFDALPIHQFEHLNGRWHERRVALREGALTFEPSPLPIPNSGDFPTEAPDGAIKEVCPAASAIQEEISSHIRAHKGASLIIDYGYWPSAFGDTLQAVSKHQYTDIFERPGAVDLTAHVDFQRLEAIAQRQNCQTETTTQGAFLLKLGLLERAGQLGRGKSHKEQETIRDAVERLAAPDQMGDLFKVLMTHS